MADYEGGWGGAGEVGGGGSVGECGWRSLRED